MIVNSKLHFFPNPQIFCIFREKFIVTAYLYNNFLGKNIFFARETILCRWKLIIAADYYFKPVLLVRNNQHLDFLKFKCIFQFGTAILTFLNIVMLNLSGLMSFIERETQNFIPKFREIFLWRELVLSTHRMKSDEKTFFCRISEIFWRKMVHVVIDRYFSLFLKGLKIFLTRGYHW